VQVHQFLQNHVSAKHHMAGHRSAQGHQGRSIFSWNKLVESFAMFDKDQVRDGQTRHCVEAMQTAQLKPEKPTLVQQQTASHSLS